MPTLRVGVASAGFDAGWRGYSSAQSSQANELHGTDGGGSPVAMMLSGSSLSAPHRHQLQRLHPRRNLVEGVLSALREGTSLLCDGQEGRNSVELVTAAYEVARKDRGPVDPRELAN